MTHRWSPGRVRGASVASSRVPECFEASPRTNLSIPRGCRLCGVDVHPRWYEYLILPGDCFLSLDWLSSLVLINDYFSNRGCDGRYKKGLAGYTRWFTARETQQVFATEAWRETGRSVVLESAAEQKVVALKCDTITLCVLLCVSGSAKIGLGDKGKPF